MAHIIGFDDGESADLDTTEGCAKYVARFLRERGASAQVFAAFGRVSKDAERFETALDRISRLVLEPGHIYTLAVRMQDIAIKVLTK